MWIDWGKPAIVMSFRFSGKFKISWFNFLVDLKVQSI